MHGAGVSQLYGNGGEGKGETGLIPPHCLSGAFVCHVSVTHFSPLAFCSPMQRLAGTAFTRHQTAAAAPA